MPARPTILVAEDDPSDQLLLRRAIERAGLAVDPEFVGDGIEAVRYLESHDWRHAPALLLLDLKMPLMDGFEVLEWLQEHPASRPGHVVVLSSCYGQVDLSRSSGLGVDHYLVKPGDPVEFAATVKRLEGYCTSNGGHGPQVNNGVDEEAELAPAA